MSGPAGDGEGRRDMSEKQQITEEQKVHEEWYKQAKAMTLEKLLEFLRHLTEDYGHDYGTICHAIAASAIAAAWAVERAPCGGITGFQAGAVMWEFISKWMSYEGKPLRLMKYEDMLFPQYATKFRSISTETWQWLQDEAKKQMACCDGAVVPSVKEHWQSIIDGRVPFGYAVEGDAI